MNSGIWKREVTAAAAAAAGAQEKEEEKTKWNKWKRWLFLRGGKGRRRYGAKNDRQKREKSVGEECGEERVREREREMEGLAMADRRYPPYNYYICYYYYYYFEGKRMAFLFGF